MNKSAEFWIKHLNLVEHPGEEDGFFAVPFEDSFTVLNQNKEERSVASIAYFLQKRAESPTMETMMFKCLSTEMLFYHTGLPMSIYILEKDATSAQDMKHVILGPRVDQGHVLVFPVPADRWFTRLVDTPATQEMSGDFTLFSCSLAPGFHIADFKATKLRNVLSRK